MRNRAAYPCQNPGCEVQVRLRNCHPTAEVTGILNIRLDTKPSPELWIQGYLHVFLHELVLKPGDLDCTEKTRQRISVQLTWILFCSTCRT